MKQQRTALSMWHLSFFAAGLELALQMARAGRGVLPHGRACALGVSA